MLTIHCSVAKSAERSRWIADKAIGTTLPSMKAMEDAPIVDANTTVPPVGGVDV